MVILILCSRDDGRNLRAVFSGCTGDQKCHSTGSRVSEATKQQQPLIVFPNSPSFSPILNLANVKYLQFPCVCVFVCVCVCVRERESVCVSSMREGERACHVCEREGERERVCVLTLYFKFSRRGRFFVVFSLMI